MFDEQQLDQKPVKHIINEMQLVLSEKRTELSVLRTGITILLFPLSALTVLLALSKNFEITKELPIAIPLAIVCLGFFVSGIYLIVRSARRIKRYDHVAQLLLRHSEYLQNLLDFRE